MPGEYRSIAPLFLSVKSIENILFFDKTCYLFAVFVFQEICDFEQTYSCSILMKMPRSRNNNKHSEWRQAIKFHSISYSQICISVSPEVKHRVPEHLCFTPAHIPLLPKSTFFCEALKIFPLTFVLRANTGHAGWKKRMSWHMSAMTISYASQFEYLSSRFSVTLSIGCKSIGASYIYLSIISSQSSNSSRRF